MITKYMPNDQFLPFVIEQLQSEPGKTVTLPLLGRSMRPFLHDGDAALLTLAQNVQVNQVVLAQVQSGCYVLHRVVGVKGQQVTLRGDGNLNTEQCTQVDVYALALGFYRGASHRFCSTRSFRWRVYSVVWTCLLPFRRYLLFMLYPHRLKWKTR